MEHFFLEDRFYSDLDDFINDLFPEEGYIYTLPDDWSIRDSLDSMATDGNEYCAHLRDKLDNLYPFLSC